MTQASLSVLEAVVIQTKQRSCYSLPAAAVCAGARHIRAQCSTESVSRAAFERCGF